MLGVNVMPPNLELKPLSKLTKTSPLVSKRRVLRQVWKDAEFADLKAGIWDFKAKRGRIQDWKYARDAECQETQCGVKFVVYINNTIKGRGSACLRDPWKSFPAPYPVTTVTCQPLGDLSNFLTENDRRCTNKVCQSILYICIDAKHVNGSYIFDLWSHIIVKCSNRSEEVAGNDKITACVKEIGLLCVAYKKRKHCLVKHFAFLKNVCY